MNWLITTIDADGKGHAEDGVFYGNQRDAKVYGQAKADAEGVSVAMFSENGHYLDIEPTVHEYTLRGLNTGALVAGVHDNYAAAEQAGQGYAWETGEQVALLEDGRAVAVIGMTGRLLTLA